MAASGHAPATTASANPRISESTPSANGGAARNQAASRQARSRGESHASPAGARKCAPPPSVRPRIGPSGLRTISRCSRPATRAGPVDVAATDAGEEQVEREEAGPQRLEHESCAPRQFHARSPCPSRAAARQPQSIASARNRDALQRSRGYRGFGWQCPARPLSLRP